MGKLVGCEILTEHPTCSRKHAVLVACKKLGPCIVDLGTANGTKVNQISILPYIAYSLTKQGEGGSIYLHLSLCAKKKE